MICTIDIYWPETGNKRQFTGLTGDTIVVAPISNDKVQGANSTSSSVSEKKRADQGTVGQGTANSESNSQNEQNIETGSVEVERANQIYNQSIPKPSSGKELITNYEQAIAVTAEIRMQIEENSLHALQAQTEGASASLSALLETAPV